MGSDPNISEAVHDGWNDHRGGQVRLAALQHELRHGSSSDTGPLPSGLHTSLRSPEPEPSPMRPKRFGPESVVSEGEGSQWGGIAQEAPRTWQLLHQRSNQGFPDPQAASEGVGNAIDVAKDVRNRWIEESAYMLGMLAKLQLQMEAEGVESPPLWRGMAEATPRTWQYLQVAVEDPNAFQRMMMGQQAGPEGANSLAQERAGLEAVKLRAQRLKQGIVSASNSQTNLQSNVMPKEQQIQQEWENNAKANEARREELRQELLKAQQELRDEFNQKQGPEAILSDGIKAVQQLRDRWMKESTHLSMHLTELHQELRMEGRPVPAQAGPDSFRMTSAGNTDRTMLSSMDSTRTGLDSTFTPMGAQPPFTGTFLGGLDGNTSPAPAGLGEGLPNYSFGSLPPGQPPPIGTAFGTTPMGMPSGTTLPYQPPSGMPGLLPPGGLSSSRTSSRGPASMMVDDVPTCPNPDLFSERGAIRRGNQDGSSTDRSSLSSEEKRHRRRSIQKAISGLDALQAQISSVQSLGLTSDQQYLDGCVNKLHAGMIPHDILPSNSSASASGYSLHDQMSTLAGNSQTNIGMQGTGFGKCMSQYGQLSASTLALGQRFAYSEDVGNVLPHSNLTPPQSHSDVSQPPSFPVTPAQFSRRLL